jgi:hypothetical protein
MECSKQHFSDDHSIEAVLWSSPFMELFMIAARCIWKERNAYISNHKVPSVASWKQAETLFTPCNYELVAIVVIFFFSLALGKSFWLTLVTVSLCFGFNIFCG